MKKQKNLEALLLDLEYFFSGVENWIMRTLLFL